MEYFAGVSSAVHQCDPKVSFNSLVNLLAHPPNKLVIYGAACSDATAYLAGMTSKANVVQVTHTSTNVALSDSSKYPSLYRAIPTDYPAIRATLVLLKRFNWKRVAVIGEKTGAGLLDATYDATVLALMKHQIDIVWKRIITADAIEDSIFHIKKNGARIILTVVSSTFAKGLAAQAFDSGVYGSQYVWFWLETFRPMWWSHNNNTINERMKAVIHYSFGFDDNNNLQDTTTTTVAGYTPNEIWKEYLRRLKMTNIPDLAAYSYDGVWFIAKALDAVVKDYKLKLENITTGNETFYQLLKSKMSSVTFTGLTGQFQIYSEEIRERLDGPARIYQYDRNGSAVEVVTYDVLNNITSNRTERGYLWKGKDDIPHDRKIILYERDVVEEWIFIVLTILCATSIFISIIFIVYLIIFMIRRTGGKFSAVLNVVIATGCICLCVSGILYGIRVTDEVNDYNQIKNTCMSQLGLTTVGLTFVLGGIISKLFGILQMYGKERSTVGCCASTLLPLLLFLATDVVLVTLWFNEDTPKPTKIYYEEDKHVLPNGRSESVPYYEFCTRKQFPDWLIMVYIFHSIQAIISLILAAATKGKSLRQVDYGTLTRCSVVISFLLLIGVILSDVTSRDSRASSKNSYIIFTSVVSGSTLIIGFCSFVLKGCCSSSNDASENSRNVKLTNVRNNREHTVNGGNQFN